MQAMTLRALVVDLSGNLQGICEALARSLISSIARSAEAAPVDPRHWYECRPSSWNSRPACS